MPLSLSATQTIPESWPDRHDPLQHATSNTPPLERTHTSNPRVTTPPALHTVPIGTITIVSVLRSSAWAPDVHGGAQSPKPSGSRISGPFVADRFPRAESGKHLRVWLFRALSPSFRCWTNRRTSNPHGGQYGTLPTTRRGVKASASVPPLCSACSQRVPSWASPGLGVPHFPAARHECLSDEPQPRQMQPSAFGQVGGVAPVQRAAAHLGELG